MYKNNFSQTNIGGGGLCSPNLRGSHPCANGECVNGKCVCTESTCQDPYCNCPSSIPSKLKDELKDFLPKFSEKFKYTFASNLKDIIICQDKNYFRIFFNFFLNTIGLDWGSMIINFLTATLSNGYVGNPNYYITDIKNWENISFNYLNDNIEYSCDENGKSYITLNLGLTNFTTDENGNETIFTIAMVINTFIYMTLVPWAIDFNPKIENLPVKLTIEVLKNNETGNMGFNLNNFHLDLDFEALMKPMFLYSLYLNFAKFFFQYRVSTMPNGFLKGFLPEFFKGDKIPGGIKKYYEKMKNVIVPINEASQQEMRYTDNSGPGIEMTVREDAYEVFFTPFSSPEKPRNKAEFLEIINENLEKIDRNENKSGRSNEKNKKNVENYIIIRNRLQGIKIFMKNCTSYLLNISLSDVLTFLYNSNSSIRFSTLYTIAKYETAFFIILSLFLFVVYMFIVSSGISYKSTFVKSKILNTNFTCDECTYNNKCSTATYTPVTESPCPPCKDACYDLKSSVLSQKINLQNNKLFQKVNNLNIQNNLLFHKAQQLLEDESCISNCQDKLSCFDTDGCGNFCAEKYINIVYNPTVVWNIFNKDSKKVIVQYTLDQNSLQQDYLILKNTSNSSKNIQINYITENDQFGVIVGDEFISTGEVFYYDISTNMYKNLKNSIIIYPSNCNDKCYLFQNDNSNCGSCGTKCEGCLKCCSGKCTDYNTDNNNCGGCGNKCEIGSYCCDGMCLRNRGADCKCLPGWSGNNCDISTPTCNNRGVIQNGKCVCNLPWQGDNCQTCPSNYKNCETMECADCYAGTNCEYSQQFCGGNGCPKYGENGLYCECTYPWEGNNCQICPPNFTNCNTLECAHCTAGKYCEYNAEYCNFNGCPIYDNNTNTISCHCNAGYSGTYCDKEL